MAKLIPGRLTEITAFFIHANVEAFALTWSIFYTGFQHTHAAYVGDRETVKQISDTQKRRKK